MRVQILKPILTVYGPLAKGDVLVVADAEAQSWVSLGYAKQAEVVEKKTAPAKTTASKPKKGTTK